MDHRYVCLVCGMQNDVPIRSELGDSRLDERCICCGVQWGTEDVTLEEIRRRRKEWLETGPEWVWPAMEPDGWEFERQLVNIPKEFR